MKRARVALAALGLSIGLGSVADAAGNGSNYIHLINGVDYFFLTGPYSGAIKGGRGIWRCFPSEILHSPTRVVDPADPNFGTYATKVCAIHWTVSGSPAHLLSFPNVTLTASDGKCHFTQSGGTALNFGLASVGVGSGLAVVGPLSGNGVPATNITSTAIVGLSIVNPAGAPNILVQLLLNLTGGVPSAITVPDGSSLALWHAEDNNQPGFGARQYWAGSLNERNICSGYSFLLSGGLTGTFTGAAFNSAWEWSTGVGTVDATFTNIVSVGASGAGPSGLDAHASTTAFAQPYDAGSGTRTVSVTGTTPFAFTSSTGNIFGFQSYDDTNPNGGGNRLVLGNLWGLSPGGAPVCNNRAPGFVQLPTGGPGGPTLSTLIPEQPRLVGKIDGTFSTWISLHPFTGHSTIPGGNNIPWFPAAATKPGGSTGNTGGVAFTLPPLPALVGLQLFTYSVALNNAGTAITKTFNNGHSHSNGVDILFFP
jgi:hypothetical protein